METAIITVSNVTGYIDKDGTIWLNAEDVARGLGFVQTQNKNGKIYTSIRWETVNRYLSEFNFPQQVGKKDFIPENMFYRLAMKAKNAVAEKFQAKVADDILPTLRKTGAYVVPQKPEKVKPSQMVMEIGAMSDALQATYGVQKGIALLKATDAIGEYYEFDLSPLKELVPPAEHEIGTLTPTAIAKKLGITPHKVNEKLIETGLQIKDGKEYRLTDEGKKYAEAMPYSRNGHSGYQIKWKPQITTILLENVVQ